MLDSGEIDEQNSIIIPQIIKKLENYIVLDKNFYRILSLSAFYNPELYSNEYLKVHLNYIYSFYGEITLAFSNLKDSCFDSLSLGEIFKDGTNYKLNQQVIQDKLGQMRITENMDVYTLIRDRLNEDYQVYKSKNIRCNTDEVPVESTRFLLSQVDDNTKYILQGTIEDFYGYCLQLKNNSTNKKQTLVNLQILSILQKESYKDFIRGLGTLIIKEYGI
jgi:DNA-binding protein